MNINELSPTTHKLLFSIPLRPLQGSRFQPTGFPGLGAATFQTSGGLNLLVESAQSMANRLEAVTWDEVTQRPIETLNGISYIEVQREGRFLTSSIIESHRINSPYILEGQDQTFMEALKTDLAMELGYQKRVALCKALFKYDLNSLLHGVFLAKKELAGGSLRVARALSAFIEASGVRVATSGGVKNDHVNPSGDAKKGFGNVPFARDEYTADVITLFVNIDIAQLRGYGLNKDQTSLLLTLALYKLRLFLDGTMRLRTACELELVDEVVKAFRPSEFTLPDCATLESEMGELINKCADLLKVSTVQFNDELKKKGDDKDHGESEESEDEKGAEA